MRKMNLLDEDKLVGMKPFYLDQIITHDDIRSDFRVNSVDEAHDLIDATDPGSYISIKNMNNLGEVLIYRRTDFDEEATDVWDGKSSDISWYHKDDDLFFISKASQLKGLCTLVSNGVTFENKEVRLMENIDLAFHDWEPIGAVYTVDQEKSGVSRYCKYDINIDVQHVFRGTFNGGGHIIYGLKILSNHNKGNFCGFFTAVDNAFIKNVIFADVNIKSSDYRVSFSAVAGVARESIFSNISTSGLIECPKPSGICGAALDTAFYNCKNGVHLIAKTNQKCGLIAGGICQQFSLSKTLLDHLNGDTPKIFVKCFNEGSIEMDGTNAKYLWAGHFFGGTYYKRNVKDFSFIMEKCKIYPNTNISVINGDNVDHDMVFYGYLDGSAKKSNNIAPSCKADLLSGLIGRVDRYVDVTVIKTTSSTIIDNMVIPGTVNTQHSDIGEDTFITIDATAIASSDEVYDLEPFFKYIKTVKI